MTLRQRDYSNRALPMPGPYDRYTSKTDRNTNLQAHKVLLVDDNQDLLELCAELLCAYGFDVITASSAEAALDVVRRQSDIEVLLSDIVMPGMSGLQLGYKAREFLPDLRVILVSGYPNPAVESGHGFLQDFDFLMKPYRIADVLRLLEQHR